MNYLKNKKYYILVSLFCLCYALGTQKVAAGKDGTIRYKAKLEVDKSGKSITAKIIGKDNDEQTIRLTLIGQNAACNIAWFSGLDDEENRRMYVSRTPSVVKQNPTSQTTTTTIDIALTGLSITLPKNENENENENGNSVVSTITGKVIANKKSWLGGESFILSYGNDNEKFAYFDQGWFSDDSMEVTTGNGLLYKESDEKDNPNKTVLEVVHRNISRRWKVYKEDLANINAVSADWYLFRTLKVKNKNWPYIQSTNIGIIVFWCTVLTAVVGYYYFHREYFNQKLKNFVG